MTLPERQQTPPPEFVHLPTKSVPFVSRLLRLAEAQQISIPMADANENQEYFATENYILTQMVRATTKDKTGILSPLLGLAKDADHVASIATGCAEHQLTLIESQHGEKGPEYRKYLLDILRGKRDDFTIDDLLALDELWGNVVRDIKAKNPENAQVLEFRQRNLQALQNAAESKNVRITKLANREFSAGGSDDGRLNDVVEAPTLPKVPSPEKLNAIIPTRLQGEINIDELTDAEVLLLEGGKIGHDVVRHILAVIRERESDNKIVRQGDNRI